ncbi:MAG: PucR family transcriptional regulator ligand-binding domain-containing protein [Treponema sp.]|nr:PucR family transcriptional regulator ligand-binding domain-containing protein [Treponema sp.]
MINLNEILKLSMFSNFKTICGKEYLGNQVNATVILEYESSKIHYSGYGPGYFVLLSYFFAKSNPEIVNGTLKTLIQKNVSGIAIKIAPEETLPSEIVHLAVKHHVPLFTFYDEFMEDLIININQSMKTRAQYIIHEEYLNSILRGTPSPDTVEKTALQINPEFKNFVRTAIIFSKNQASNLQVHTFFDKMMYRKYQYESNTNYSFVKMGNGVVIICSFENDDAVDFNGYISKLLKENNFSPEDFYIGACEELLPLYSLNDSIQKANCAKMVCKFHNLDYMCYRDLGIYKYAMAVIQNKMLCEDMFKKIDIIKNYDKKHESNLLKTIISYVNNNSDIQKTSEECFQHTNTIRYRIKKAEELIGLKENTAEEEITFMVRCYLLRQIMAETL